MNDSIFTVFLAASISGDGAPRVTAKGWSVSETVMAHQVAFEAGGVALFTNLSPTGGERFVKAYGPGQWNKITKEETSDD